MQLQATDLLANRLILLQEKRSTINKIPGIVDIWVGDDEQTAKFIKVKQNMAKTLDCQFFQHHFPRISPRQLASIIESLNQKKEVHGIIIQLPLPHELDDKDFLSRISPKKDIDGMLPNSVYPAPTAAGIIALLEENKIDPATCRTMIIGDGQLVGHPLATMFRERSWKFTQINENASENASEIAKHNLVICCTGVPDLITPEMVTKETILIDGSGVDVNISALEPLVKVITPKKGAIGPLTVSFLFENLLSAAS